MPTHHLMQKGQEKKQEEKICLFAQTNFRNQMIRFGIKTDDRRRHTYVIGKTGMGKTTMMENMVLHDIYNGHGIGVVDPHGDFAEKIIDYIPSWRINDVVYINPADVNYPIGFNIFEIKNEEQKHLIASGLMATFQKIWPDVWSSRMEYILNNTILALLDFPGSTLLGINRLLADKKFRQKVVKQLKDPVVKSFWQDEFANYEPRYAKEAVAPIQNKIGQFLSASVIRNMVAQVKSTIDVRDIMDSGKILIMNLAKGRIGEDNSRLLGGMLINKLQLSAMERVDIPEEKRTDFFLYVDEFQNFATPSFANILSEARKYRLSLIMAHQYVKQLDEVVADAVFGNVGTIVTFRIGAADAEALAKEFAPVFTEEHIVNLNKYNILLKLMIDGVASQPFSATTMSPIGSPTGSAEKVIRVSRERYAKTRKSIEEKILKWSGMEVDTSDNDDDDDSFEHIHIQKEKPKTQVKKEEKNNNKPNNTNIKTDISLSEILSSQKQENNTVKTADISTSYHVVEHEEKEDDAQTRRKNLKKQLDDLINADIQQSAPQTFVSQTATATEENDMVDFFDDEEKDKKITRVDDIKTTDLQQNSDDMFQENIDTKKSEDNQQSQNTSDSPKKKRKRKRKKKKNNNNNNNNNNNVEDQSYKPSSDEQNVKKISADEIITFD